MAHKLNHHTLPILSIGALGGTVSMRATQSGTGATPALTGEALLEGISQLHEGLDVRVDTLCLIPSASLDFNLMLEVLIWAQEQVKLGVQGVVITQGTDTLEETAFFLDLLWNVDVPLVLTGAMRPSDRPSADGPANLLDAARVALDTQSRKRGVLICRAGETREPVCGFHPPYASTAFQAQSLCWNCLRYWFGDSSACWRNRRAKKLASS